MARRPIVTTEQKNQKRLENDLFFVEKEEPETRPNPKLKKPMPIIVAAPLVSWLELALAAAVLSSGEIPVQHWDDTVIAIGVVGLIIAMAIGAGGTRDPREAASKNGWMLPARPEDTDWIYRFMSQNMRESTRYFAILALGSIVVIFIGIALASIMP